MKTVRVWQASFPLTTVLFLVVAFDEGAKMMIWDIKTALVRKR